jgi:hypothetical protein
MVRDMSVVHSLKNTGVLRTELEVAAEASTPYVVDLRTLEYGVSGRSVKERKDPIILLVVRAPTNKP